ncbi:hypothetical protein BDE02_05G122700 [Populus trichocarpa]|nr:hypothetical protein BDE02_05G122700 [Populus trichocarpa]
MPGKPPLFSSFLFVPPSTVVVQRHKPPLQLPRASPHLCKFLALLLQQPTISASSTITHRRRLHPCLYHRSTTGSAGLSPYQVSLLSFPPSSLSTQHRRGPTT